MQTTSQTAAIFEANRPFLMGLAYRLLGRYTEAEDLVQETYLRWHRNVDNVIHIQNPKAYLSRILTRLCLDYLKSARVRREEYIGPWLPEPVLESQIAAADKDEESLDKPGDLSYALMITLERLSPLERVVFILHDIFSLPFSEVAEILERTEPACRKLASRARKNIQEEKKRYQPSIAALNKLIPAFMKAAATQDVKTLGQLLAQEASLHADGGGIVLAAIHPIMGAEQIIKFFCGLYRKYPELSQTEQRFIRLNGAPAWLHKDTEGLTQVLLFVLDENEKLSGIYVIRNPQKTSHLF